MRCQICGAEMSDNNKFCLACGAKLIKDTPQPEVAPPWASAPATPTAADTTPPWASAPSAPAATEEPWASAPAAAQPAATAKPAEPVKPVAPAQAAAPATQAAPAQPTVSVAAAAPPAPAAPVAPASATPVAPASAAPVAPASAAPVAPASAAPVNSAAQSAAFWGSAAPAQDNGAQQPGAVPPAPQPHFFDDNDAPIVSVGHWLYTILLWILVPVAALLLASFLGREIGNITVYNILLVVAYCSGLILMFIWAFNKRTNPSKKNFFRAMLIVTAIIIVVTIIIALTVGNMLMSSMDIDELLYWMNQAQYY